MKITSTINPKMYSTPVINHTKRTLLSTCWLWPQPYSGVIKYYGNLFGWDLKNDIISLDNLYYDLSTDSFVPSIKKHFEMKHLQYRRDIDKKQVYEQSLRVFNEVNDDLDKRFNTSMYYGINKRAEENLLVINIKENYDEKPITHHFFSIR